MSVAYFILLLTPRQMCLGKNITIKQNTTQNTHWKSIYSTEVVLALPFFYAGQYCNCISTNSPDKQSAC